MNNCNYSMFQQMQEADFSSWLKYGFMVSRHLGLAHFSSRNRTGSVIGGKE